MSVALSVFGYGITISGYIIDKCGVAGSLMLGLALYVAAQFVLVFADTRW